MAQDKDNEEKDLQQFNINQRKALNNAYAALEGQKTSQSFAAFTFEEAMDLQIERIEGKGTRLRPNELDRVDRIEQEMTKAVAELKDVSPDQILEPDEDNDVNT